MKSITVSGRVIMQPIFHVRIVNGTEKKFCDFRICNSDDNFTEFYNVRVYDSMAQSCNDDLTTGSEVMLAGPFHQDVNKTITIEPIVIGPLDRQLKYSEPIGIKQK